MNLKKLSLNEKAERVLVLLGFSSDVVKGFSEGSIYCSAANTGDLCRVESETLIKRISTIEEHGETKVYHLIIQPDEFRIFLMVLKENIQTVKRGKGAFLVYGYVENLTNPEFSEHGSVKVQKMSEGLGVLE